MAKDNKNKKKLSVRNIGLIAGGSGLFLIIMIVIIAVATKKKPSNIIPVVDSSDVSLLSTL